jgi:hypothetical protein
VPDPALRDQLGDRTGNIFDRSGRSFRVLMVRGRPVRAEPGHWSVGRRRTLVEPLSAPAPSPIRTPPRSSLGAWRRYFHRIQPVRNWDAWASARLRHPADEQAGGVEGDVTASSVPPLSVAGPTLRTP